MVFHPERTAIVGATGPTGYHLARELVGRGRAVRVVSRRREHLERVFAGLPVEIATADAMDADSLARAVEGCDLLVDAIGLPPNRMAGPHREPSPSEGAGAPGAIGSARTLPLRVPK